MGNFDPFVNNANLGAIAQNEQWHLNFHCLSKKNDLRLIKTLW